MNRHHVVLFLQRGEMLAAVARSSDPARLAWVGVYPLDPSCPLTAEFLRNEAVVAAPTSSRPICHVHYFEVDRELIERDASVADHDLVNPQSLFAFGTDDLTDKLKRLGVELEDLERPFKSDYPI
jgi:hypothetical protein